MAKRAQGTRDPLRDFEHLPPSAHVDGATVDLLYGISPATRWRRIHDGTLPRPVKFGPRCTRFSVGALRALRERLEHAEGSSITPDR